MRIIDKNTDFYDYYQNMYPDNSLTFDRTDSFILSKDDLCRYLYVDKYTRDGDFEYLLLQVTECRSNLIIGYFAEDMSATMDEDPYLAGPRSSILGIPKPSST